MRFFLFLFLQIALFGADFDCVLIGTSPFCLFEALYQHHSGKRVLILEEAPCCGGAWRSIHICGIPNADLGCHQIGNNENLKTFLEDYAGCKIVPLDDPTGPFNSKNCPNGWYFSKGCFELIDNLLKLIGATDIVLLTNCKAERLIIDQKTVLIETNQKTFSTEKLIVTPMSHVGIDPVSKQQKFPTHKYYHLYMLIQDPTPPRFSYQNAIAKGVTRVMNLTHFVGMIDTGRQLIAFQTNSEQSLSDGQTYLEALKTKKWVDPSAYILQSETYIYESGSFQRPAIAQAGAESLIEVLQTGHFNNLNQYTDKWKKVLNKVEKF